LVPALGHVPNDDVIATRIENLQVRRQVIVMHGSAKANPTVVGVVEALQAAARILARRMPAITATVTG
jgi:uncharacterized membrane protein